MYTHTHSITHSHIHTYTRTHIHTYTHTHSLPMADRLTGKGLMEYLNSEENNVLDMDHLNQNHDMSQPVCHYYINSSHNSYLTGKSHDINNGSRDRNDRSLDLTDWSQDQYIITTKFGRELHFGFSKSCQVTFPCKGILILAYVILVPTQLPNSVPTSLPG